MNSWFGWVEKHYYSDLIVTAAGEVTNILTARPFDESVVDEIRGTQGVRIAQGLRRVEIQYLGKPAMLVAYDVTPVALPTLNVSWEAVRRSFWQGQGVFISESLAYRTGLTGGNNIALPAPNGIVTLPILSVYRDVYGGDLGAIAIARSAYVDLWGDHLVDRVRVWTDLSTAAAQATLNSKLSVTYGLEAVSYKATMASLKDLIANAFAITYALIFVCLVVSGIGILNFLLSRNLERRNDYRVLLAVGTSPWQVVRSVMVEALFIAFTGIAVGLFAGVMVSRMIIDHSVPMVNGWHFDYFFPYTVATEVVLGVLVGALVASLIPGRLAADARQFQGHIE